MDFKNRGESNWVDNAYSWDTFCSKPIQNWCFSDNREMAILTGTEFFADIYTSCVFCYSIACYWTVYIIPKGHDMCTSSVCIFIYNNINCNNTFIADSESSATKSFAKFNVFRKLNQS